MGQLDMASALHPDRDIFRWCLLFAAFTRANFSLQTFSINKVGGAKRRWRSQFCCRGSRHESAVTQLSAFDHGDDNMKLSVWLDAQNEIDKGFCTLPAIFPRPDTLVSPHTDAELEAWCRLEAARRQMIDAVVREWVAYHRWPDVLDMADGYFVFLRLRAAKDWLDLGAVGAIAAEHPTALLSQLVIEGWSECFLSHHLRELDYRRAEFLCGQTERDESKEE